MMGDSPHTYYTELSLERWCMLLDKSIKKQRHKLNNPKTHHHERIIELIKENEKLKEDIKKLKKRVAEEEKI